jgi:hypothetical protein
MNHCSEVVLYSDYDRLDPVREVTSFGARSHCRHLNETQNNLSAMTRQNICSHLLYINRHHITFRSQKQWGSATKLVTCIHIQIATKAGTS